MPHNSPLPWIPEHEATPLVLHCAAGYPVLTAHGKPGAPYAERQVEAAANLQLVLAAIHYRQAAELQLEQQRHELEQLRAENARLQTIVLHITDPAAAPGQKTGLPPRRCRVTDHAAKRYRERFTNIPDAANALRRRLDRARQLTKGERKQLADLNLGYAPKPWNGLKSRGVYWYYPPDDLVIVTTFDGREFNVITCFRLKPLEGARP
jgi:hypothetical protein